MRFSPIGRALLASAAVVACLSVSPAVHAQATSFTQSLAQSASSDEAIAAWYRQTGYQTLWTGAADFAASVLPLKAQNPPTATTISSSTATAEPAAT